VIIAERLLEFEKDRKKVKQLMKKPKFEGGAAFHEKSTKNKKVNLGGPAKTKPRKTESRNRGVERTRDAKKKKKK
jgi:ATP-dependent RNA helicase RhlE